MRSVAARRWLFGLTVGAAGVTAASYLYGLDEVGNGNLGNPAADADKSAAQQFRRLPRFRQETRETRRLTRLRALAGAFTLNIGTLINASCFRPVDQRERTLTLAIETTIVLVCRDDRVVKATRYRCSLLLLLLMCLARVSSEAYVEYATSADNAV